MLWEKKPQAPLPNPSPAAVPHPKPLPEIKVKDAMLKPTESVMTNMNHSFVSSSCVLKGDLSGDEDLLIEGQFDGTINLHEGCLTVGAHGQVKADVQAARAIISGSVTGNITARERIEIRKSGRVLGDLVAPSISIEDGAYFKGSIEILREEKPSLAGVVSEALPEESSV